jgi:hypothetical protein
LIEEALRINPYLHIKEIDGSLRDTTMEDFLMSADVVVDAMDFFAYKERLTLLKICRDKNLFVVSSGNAGFGASLFIFDPQGMDLNKFLGVSLTSGNKDLMAAFALAWMPKQLSGEYTDPSYVSLESKIDPATSVAGLLASGLIITEILKIVLKQSSVKPVPHYVQVDAHQGKYVQGILRFGNRSICQRIRRYVLINHYWGKLYGFKPVPPPGLPLERVTSLPVPERIIRAILTAGIQAPSGDNIQPWLFYIDGEKIHIAIDELIDQSYFNFHQLPSLLSSGALLENMCLASSSYGLKLIIENRGGESRSHIATISFELTDDAKDPLSDVIWERNTNRRLYFDKHIPSSIIKKLRDTALVFEGVKWHEVTNKESLKLLARAVYLVDILRSERKDLHEHFQKMLRFSEKSVYKKQDGLPLRNLKAGWDGEIFLRLTHPWKVTNILNFFGFSHLVANFAYKEIISSSHCVMLSAPSLESKQCIIVGQALERVWLEANHNDLAFQPMAGLPIFLLRKKLEEDTTLSLRHKNILAEAEALERKVFPDFNPHHENQLIMFRLGYAKPIEVGTLRRPLDSFIRPA